jgi:hypothetical protein
MASGAVAAIFVPEKRHALLLLVLLAADYLVEELLAAMGKSAFIPISTESRLCPCLT